jgi:hypothetical protein
VVLCGVVWCGVVWCSVVWCWCGVVLVLERAGYTHTHMKVLNVSVSSQPTETAILTHDALRGATDVAVKVSHTGCVMRPT